MKRKNVLVITYWSFLDALVQTYTLPYVRMIRENISGSSRIYLVTFEQKHLQVSERDRKAFKKELIEQGIIWVDYQYLKFGVVAFIKSFIILVKMLWMIIAKRIDYIHAWCTPAGTLGYILSVLTGKPLIIDSYEPHAEVMLETRTWKGNSLKFKLLFLFEKLQGRHAKVLITCTADMKDYCKRKFDIELTNYWVKPACVNLNQFSYVNRKNPHLLKEKKLEEKIVAVYAGKFGGLYLTQEVFDFFKVSYDFWKGKFRVLLLTTEKDENLDLWKHKAGLPDGIVLKEFVSHNKVADYIGLGDFGISPYNPVPSRKYSAPIKNPEYWALGLPVVITNNIGDDSVLIEQSEMGFVLKELTSAEYLKSIEKIDKLLLQNSTLELYEKIRPVAEKYRNYSTAQKIYHEIYGN